MRCRLLLVAAGLLVGCGAGPRARTDLESLERLFDSARYVHDQLEATRARGASTSVHGVTAETLDRARAALWAAVARKLDSLPETRLDSADRRALSHLRARVAGARREDPGAGGGAATAECPYVLRGGESLDSIGARVFRCYGRAAERIVVGGDTLDRLSIFGLLGATGSPARRERLFRALDGVWRSVNGDDGAASPYREMVRLRRERWRQEGSAIDARSRRFGIEPDTAEQWLMAGLEAWRRVLPDRPVEPWDYYYLTGEAGRRLEGRIPRDSLLAINHRFYASLGAAPEPLGVRYDVDPRPGKYPIAFSNFGGRSLPWGPGWVRSEPWVFASYRIGGLGNLVELLHETGHAVHIAAIRTRPAFHDWPDADLFTEGIADLASLEAYEPAWQLAFLGDSAPLGPSLREKYGSVMLDMAWSLFEIRVHRDSAPSPNAVWTDITSRYLGIRPHPELSWWAMRGQLVESPGYMMNYAVGAFVVADLRAAVRNRLGSQAQGDRRWYGLVSDGLFRFGAEVPARAVVDRFLGRAPSPAALLEDLARLPDPAN